MPEATNSVVVESLVKTGERLSSGSQEGVVSKGVEGGNPESPCADAADTEWLPCPCRLNFAKPILRETRLTHMQVPEL